MKLNRLEYIGGAATVLAVAGVVLNNYRLWPCFVLWLASNAATLYVHAKARIWSLAVRDAIFLGLAVHGLYQWTR